MKAKNIIYCSLECKHKHTKQSNQTAILYVYMSENAVTLRVLILKYEVEVVVLIECFINFEQNSR